MRNGLAAILLLAFAANSDDTRSNSLLELEKSGIDKIVRLTAKERSTVLFTVADYAVGYAKEGRLQWIGSTDYRPTPCGWPHPALSRDGLRVAFVSDSDTPKQCRIVVHDMRTDTQRNLVETAYDPGEISWSWDGSEIAFFERGISAVSVSTGTKRMLLPFPRKVGDVHQYTFGVWNPMQWLHNGTDLVVELETQVPTNEPGTHTYRGNVLIVRDGDTQLIDIGSAPSVAPSSDRIAYYSAGAIVAIDADKTRRRVLAKAPRTMLFREDLWGWIVWSPDGNRLFFHTIVSENRSDKVYLLDVKSGRREQFLSSTSIRIRGWQ